MDGSQHYQEAERLLEEMKDISKPMDRAIIAEIAQVHATLALIAHLQPDKNPRPADEFEQYEVNYLRGLARDAE